MKAKRADAAVQKLRVPPQSVEAEQAVLGGLMLSPDALTSVADLLQPEDFYRRDHQLIFQAVKELDEKKRPFDAVTLGEWFDSMGLSEQVAGGAYLIELASTTPSAANIRAYAEIVADKKGLRDLIEFGTGVVNDGFDSAGRDSSEIAAAAAAQSARLASKNTGNGGLRLVRGAMKATWTEIRGRNDGSLSPGLPLPHANARKLIPGLEDTDLMVIAARPAMGKTVIALEVADYAAELGRNVAVFSLEMGENQLTQRLLSRRSGVNGQRMREEGGLQDEDWSLLQVATEELLQLPLAIDATASLTVEAIRARCFRMHNQVAGGLGLVVIDYLQLITGSNPKDKRHDQVAHISRSLKLLAKDLSCPVVAVSQLNRGSETRNDKRPTMADLRESGAIEQDADIIVFVFRDDYYTKEECSAPGIAEFIVAKNRTGGTGTIFLRHELECSRFRDYFGPRPVYKKKAVDGGGGGDDEDGFDEPPRRRRRRGRDAAAGGDA
ncbi:replicative DNA helicase [Lysobacter sp. 5GHs7-4]|uniref:replicative DNA helicase n=1 Tax=Lysobacter sp. 5GHs7-4 TaxID=2904253 RepID=UPI001E2BC0B6|nr:replicative DNA helicase [Lysobacter sp. 5GHs7-4]UHQ21912.1 replicative DNA helicase [Lysobacter sp. 5GHs7-4]